MGESALNSSHLDMLTRRIEDMKERMIDPQEFGRMEQQVDQLATQLADMQQTLSAISKTLSEAKGGWRALMWAGGASAAAGGLVTWVLQHLRVLP